VARDKPADPQPRSKGQNKQSIWRREGTNTRVYSFIKGNHTCGSLPACGSRQTQHADPLPRGKSQDGRSLTSNVYPTLFNTSTATPYAKTTRPGPLLLMMMKRIKSNYHHLQVFKTAKPQLRRALIKNCSSELVKSISECVLNVLRNNLQMSECQKKRLQKFKGSLRALADKRVSISAKRRLINLRGGFLVPLLSAILTTISSLIYRSRDA